MAEFTHIHNILPASGRARFEPGVSPILGQIQRKTLWAAIREVLTRWFGGGR